MVSTPTVKLNSGHEMPLVGFGTWKIDAATCADAVYNAIKAGYRLIDGAAIYGNEAEVGDGVANAIKDGLVKREELFLVSKLWPTFHDPKHVEQAVKLSLSDWKLSYFDLYYINFPFSMGYVDPKVRYPNDWADEYTPGTATLEETWHAMEALVLEGLVKSIGVSNYNGATLMDLLRYAKTKPAVLQIEHHPYLTQESLVSFAKDAGIQLTAYSSFRPTSFVELNLPRAQDAVPLFEQDPVKAAASRHGKTPAQILLRWSTQREFAVIPKSVNPQRLSQNLDVVGFDLDEKEIKAISALNRGLRLMIPWM